MKNSFTFNELISFVCGENEKTEKTEVEVACQTDNCGLSNSKMSNFSLSISPEKRIINNILNYSRALSIVRTKEAGNFNLMMN